jgi:hypothetical protein
MLLWHGDPKYIQNQLSRHQYNFGMKYQKASENQTLKQTLKEN